MSGNILRHTESFLTARNCNILEVWQTSNCARYKRIRGNLPIHQWFSGMAMKKILIAVAILGMLIPALAFAELNYNAVDIGYSTTSYNPDLTEFDFGVSKSYSDNTYLGVSYGAGTQPVGSTLGENKKINSISFSAGYHTPFRENVDTIARTHIIFGSAKYAGGSASANGYDIGVGVRAQFAHAIEGTLAVDHASTSNGALTANDTFLSVQFGFNFIRELQMTAGMDFRPILTTNFGLRFFY